MFRPTCISPGRGLPQVTSTRVRWKHGVMTAAWSRLSLPNQERHAMDNKDRVYTETENLWDEQWPTESVDTQGGHPGAELDNENELTPFPGEVGTTDEIEAVRD